MAKKELTVKTIVVSIVDGKRIERPWDEIHEAEQKIISKNITDRFMAAAGYRRADRDPIRAQARGDFADKQLWMTATPVST